jgi:4-hydroxybenzoate polyprenyltransferase
MLSGSVYIINDLQDVEGDRLHPKKRLRPIAAREVTPRQAGIFCGILMVLAMAWAVTLGWAFAACAGLYWLLVLSYSLGLKHMVIVDVMSLAAGFVLRALAGIYVLETVWSDIPITEWFLTCTMFLALFIALCKRRAEMVGMEQAAEMRRVLSDYTVPLLDQLIAMASTLTIMSYALYCMQKNPQLLVTLPFVMFGVMRFLWHVYRNDEGGAPEVLLFKDPAMLICVSVWAGLVATVMVH